MNLGAGRRALAALKGPPCEEYDFFYRVDGAALTVMVTSVFVDIAPSFAVARRMYVPGCWNRAVIEALPSATGVEPAGSRVTFAGPRICIHETVRPRGRGVAFELVCA